MLETKSRVAATQRARDIHTYLLRQDAGARRAGGQNLNFASKCLLSLDGNQPPGGQHTNVC